MTRPFDHKLGLVNHKIVNSVTTGKGHKVWTRPKSFFASKKAHVTMRAP